MVPMQWHDLGESHWDPGNPGTSKMKPAWLGLILNYLGKAVQSGKRMEKNEGRGMKARHDDGLHDLGGG